MLPPLIDLIHRGSLPIKYHIIQTIITQSDRLGKPCISFIFPVDGRSDGKERTRSKEAIEFG